MKKSEFISAIFIALTFFVFITGSLVNSVDKKSWIDDFCIGILPVIVVIGILLVSGARRVEERDEERYALLTSIKYHEELVPKYEEKFGYLLYTNTMLEYLGYSKNRYEQLKKDYSKYSETNSNEIPFLQNKLNDIKAIISEAQRVVRAAEEYFKKIKERAERDLYRDENKTEDSNTKTELTSVAPLRDDNNSKVYKKFKKTEQDILDKYENKNINLTPEEIGRRYERYIGYLYEIDGYKVQYNGIVMGKKDDGIDIIASKRNELIIIQCKWYKEDSQIHSNTIRQLSDNLNDWTEDNPNKKVKARLYTVYDNLDEQARTKLARTQIEHHVVAYDNDYPKIKCNINDDTKEKIYHLPGVGQYDRIKINIKQGEGYAKSVEEAKELGFRSANYRDFSDIETDLDENFYNFIIDYKKLKYGCSIYKKDLSEDDFEMYSIMIGGV